MSLRAFYLEPEKWTPDPILTGAEAEHARVLRLKAGDTILLLNGQGKSATCHITHFRKKVVELGIDSEDFTPAPLSRPILALALSKAVRRGFFMEKASELGAWEIWLWQSEHAQGKLSENLERACLAQLIAGLKQSQNPWLPRLRALDNVDTVARQASTADWRLLPWEDLDRPPMLEPDQLGRPGLTVYVIGPEGGFAASEVATLKDAGFATVSLGSRVLRCETAATLCLGLHWWASQLPGHPDFREPGDAGA